MKIMESYKRIVRIIKFYENLWIQHDNYENHENHRVPGENQENHQNPKTPLENF